MLDLDRPLAVRAQNDPDAFTELYERYAARVLVYMQYRCDDAATAQDLAAQVFERVLRGLNRYQPDSAPFAAWLFGIARHVATDWQRRQTLRAWLPWEAIARRPAGDPGPEQAALENEERRQLRLALARLPGRERDLIGLRFTSGLTNRQIARLTGLGESHVAVLLYRALGKLRALLADPAATPDSGPRRESANQDRPQARYSKQGGGL